jgi:hypothetical protein
VKSVGGIEKEPSSARWAPSPILLRSVSGVEREKVAEGRTSVYVAITQSSLIVLANSIEILDVSCFRSWKMHTERWQVLGLTGRGECINVHCYTHLNTTVRFDIIRAMRRNFRLG